MSSCSIPIYICKDTGAYIQERMQSCKCKIKRSQGNEKEKKITLLSYREEYGPINGDGESASLVCREVIMKCCTRTRGQLA